MHPGPLLSLICAVALLASPSSLPEKGAEFLGFKLGMKYQEHLEAQGAVASCVLDASVVRRCEINSFRRGALGAINKLSLFFDPTWEDRLFKIVASFDYAALDTDTLPRLEAKYGSTHTDNDDSRSNDEANVPTRRAKHTGQVLVRRLWSGDDFKIEYVADGLSANELHAASLTLSRLDYVSVTPERAMAYRTALTEAAITSMKKVADLSKTPAFMGYELGAPYKDVGAAVEHQQSGACSAYTQTSRLHMCSLSKNIVPVGGIGFAFDKKWNDQLYLMVVELGQIPPEPVIRKLCEIYGDNYSTVNAVNGKQVAREWRGDNYSIVLTTSKASGGFLDAYNRLEFKRTDHERLAQEWDAKKGRNDSKKALEQTKF